MSQNRALPSITAFARDLMMPGVTFSPASTSMIGGRSSSASDPGMGLGGSDGDLSISFSRLVASGASAGDSQAAADKPPIPTVIVSMEKH